MPRPHLPKPLAALLALLIIGASFWFWMYLVPSKIGGSLPRTWQAFFGQGDVPALLTLFIALPIALASLAVIAMIFASMLLRTFVPRSQARRWLEALANGENIGRGEAWLLTLFKDDSLTSNASPERSRER
jgi:hypothetical protein